MYAEALVGGGKECSAVRPGSVQGQAPGCDEVMQVLQLGIAGPCACDRIRGSSAMNPMARRTGCAVDPAPTTYNPRSCGLHPLNPPLKATDDLLRGR